MNPAEQRSKYRAKINRTSAKQKRAVAKYRRSPTESNRRKMLKLTQKTKYYQDVYNSLAKGEEGGKFARSANYRQQFIKANPGLLFHLYFCIYCGRLITRDIMQVDHLVAVNQVKKNPMWKILFFFDKEGVNSTMNLFPACPRCNRLKSDKGGLWITRGQLGGTVWTVMQSIHKIFAKIFKSKYFWGLAAAGIIIFLITNPSVVMLIGSFLGSPASWFSSDVLKKIFLG